MPGRPPRVLILGGTTEARELAALAAERWGSRVEVITSLAGRTAAPAALAGTVRRGGFGGAAGLAAYLCRERIDVVVDATHPFAARISRHAAEAAAEAGIACLALTRPPWRPVPGDRWIEVDTAGEAAARCPGLGRRVWLTVGGGDLDAFAACAGVWFLVRRIERPATPPPLRDCALVLGRGPFTVENERALISKYRIDALVCRASGGAATRAKLDAAREARLPVVMIRRPLPAAATEVPPAAAGSPHDALLWLAGRLET